MKTPQLEHPGHQASMRPRPLGHVKMYHEWRDLLFLHWTVDPGWVQSRLPVGLKVDTFGGMAHIGIVCFKMERVRPWWAPAIPDVSDFLEMNVRVYCHDGHGRHGVHFLSLDCHQPVAVWGARTFWGLNYQHARMKSEKDGNRHSYAVQRRGQTRRAHYAWTPDPVAEASTPGTLAYFLVERYILFVRHRSRLMAGEVHHAPYAVAAAQLESWSSVPLMWNGADASEMPPCSVLCSPGVGVEVFGLKPVTHAHGAQRRVQGEHRS